MGAIAISVCEKCQFVKKMSVTSAMIELGRLQTASPSFILFLPLFLVLAPLLPRSSVDEEVEVERGGVAPRDPRLCELPLPSPHTLQGSLLSDPRLEETPDDQVAEPMGLVPQQSSTKLPSVSGVSKG